MNRIIKHYEACGRDIDDIYATLTGAQSAIVSINGAVMLVACNDMLYIVDIGTLRTTENRNVVIVDPSNQ